MTRGRPPKIRIEKYPNNLRALREARGMSQTKVGELVGLAGGTVGKIERGDLRLKMDQIAAFARALDCRPFEILGGETPLTPREKALLDLFKQLPGAEQDRLLEIGAVLAKPGDDEPDDDNGDAKAA